jgi:hypothetical protein
LSGYLLWQNSYDFRLDGMPVIVIRISVASLESIVAKPKGQDKEAWNQDAVVPEYRTIATSH